MRLSVMRFWLAGVMCLWTALSLADAPMQARVCVDPDWEPYERLHASGEFTGIAADLLRLIAQRSSVELEIYPTTSWQETLVASQNGACELIAFLNQTPERERWLIFTEPYFTDPNVFITREDHEYIVDPAGLNQKTIVFPVGTSLEEYVRSVYPNLSVIQVETEAEALDYVLSRRADMTLRSLTVTAYTIRQQGLFNLKIAGQLPHRVNEFRIGVLKDHPELRDRLNQGIATLTPQEIQEAVNRYISIRVFSGMDYGLILRLSLASVLVILLISYGYWRESRLNNRLKANELSLQAEISARIEMAEKLQQIRLRLEKSLREEQEMGLAQQQFLRMVAHEFRTPLSVLQSGFDLLECVEPDNKALIQKTLGRQRDAVRRMTELVNRALSEDRIQHCLWCQNAQWIQPESFMAALVSYMDQIMTAQHRLQWTLEARAFQGDPELLEVALHNLLENAVKYSQQGGLIQLKMWNQDDNLCISVQDEGPGIPLDEQSTIFGKYQRGRQAKAAGLGLGLYLVERIVRLHGGRIQLDSLPGQGCCFTLILPPANAADLQ